MLGDWIRRTAFWCLDGVKGGKIKKNYKEIKKMMENGEPNSNQLHNLLDHATKNTEYYKDYSPSDILTFPVINKNIVKERWNELYSKEHVNKPVHKMHTSGSTGTPFVMEWDMGKRSRQLAELIYFNEIVGQKLGQRYVYFRVWTEKNKKTKMELLKQNLIPINILHLDNEKLERIRYRLKKRPYINSCLAYASTYEYLVKYIKSKGDTPDMFKIKTLVSGSEVLSMENKKLIKETIGCNIVDRYSNEENGFIAQTGDLSDEFVVNTSGFFMEILNENSDEPVKIGEVGRIVVTDLYGYALPLIRYDTGDLAIKAEEKNGWVTKIKTIQGRKVDIIYDTEGRRLTSHTWSVYMWKFDKLKQYQFIQNGKKDYVLKVNGAAGIYTDAEFVEHLKSVLGNDAEITIEHVDGIPSLSSGKFKKTVCNYTPNSQD